MRGWVGGRKRNEATALVRGVKTLSKKVPSSVFSSPSAPVVCNSTAADPPSPFCVQIHSHSVELCGQGMLSETALKLAEAGTESCRVGVVALPLPPLPPTPSPLVSTGRQWKEKDKAGALKKRATAQQPFLKMTVSMIPFVSDFLSFAVTAPYVNYSPIPIPGG